jgi:Zn-dependent alcohol dehydrogenase
LWFTGGAGRVIKNTFSLEEIHEAIETVANGDAVKVMVTM